MQTGDRESMTLDPFDIQGPLEFTADKVTLGLDVDGLGGTFTRGTVIVDASSVGHFIDARTPEYYSALYILIPLVAVLALRQILPK